MRFHCNNLLWRIQRMFGIKLKQATGRRIMTCNFLERYHLKYRVLRPLDQIDNYGLSKTNICSNSTDS